MTKAIAASLSYPNDKIGCPSSCGQTITIPELVRAAPITLRQAYLWLKSGLAGVRRRRGYRLRLTFDQALAFLTAAKLRSKKYTPVEIRRMKLAPAKADYLVIYRGRPYWFDRETAIRKAAKAAGPIHLVSVRDLRIELIALMAAKRRSAALSPHSRRYTRAIAAAS